MFGPVERLIYRALGIDAERDMTALQYTRAVLMFSAAGFLVLYIIQRIQGHLPFNPISLKGVRPDIAMNTSISFVTNTNWQAYVPETTVSYLTQAAGLAVQNFVSAATGMAVAVAMIRGFTRSDRGGIGNFWADIVRGTLYILIPISLVFATVLIARGAVMTFDGPAHVKTLEGAAQTITRGPAASQVAIKQLGTNGGGFFNANSAHPFESSTPLTDFLHIAILLLIPFSFPFLYGRMLGRMKEGLAILAAMLILISSLYAVSLAAETRTTPALTAAGMVHAPNLEGKEMRNTVQEASIFSDLDDGDVDRCGQLGARLADGRRRWRCHDRDPARRDRAWRRRHRALRDPDVRGDHRVRRWSDGRADARVPRQDDRCA